jgi:TnpA family transposase
MKRIWDEDELIDVWTLRPDEIENIKDAYPDNNRLGLAILLKFVQHEGRFPESKKEIPKVVVEFLAKQLGIAAREFRQYSWQGRAMRRHRLRVRDLLGFRQSTAQDAETLKIWLRETLLPHQQNLEAIRAALINHCRTLKIEPPTKGRLERIVRSAQQSYEDQFCGQITAQLTKHTLSKLDALLDVPGTTESDSEENKRSTWYFLKTDTGRVSLDSVLDEFQKLEQIKQLELPDTLFAHVPAKTLEGYRQRIAVEDLIEIRRHPEAVRYTLMAAFCWVRRQQIVDNLVDLLIDVVHRMGVRAEKKVDTALLKEIKRVRGKDRVLYEVSAASLERPDGLVRDVVYSVVDKSLLEAIVEEYRATGTYEQQVHTVIRGSYGHYYRRMLPALLEHLQFQANNQLYRPVIEALDMLKKYAESDQHHFDDDEHIPIEGIVPDAWHDLIIQETNSGKTRVNRIAYEICVLQALRDKLLRRVVWVEGAHRFRNPDADLPQDFAAQQAIYYDELEQPLDPDVFIQREKQALRTALQQLNDTISKNAKVKFTKRGEKNWILVSPSEAQTEPTNLTALKNEVQAQWGWIQLLDILKETNFRTDFTDLFKSVTAHEQLSEDVLQKRLLLCLYALGTNIGIKRISVGEHGQNYRDLLYVRKRFITKDNLRAAIAQVVNAILAVRQPHIWGEATSCASDSKKFGAWDQNLLTEWHIRYRGPGIMVYWHVEKKSLCIYSQVKSCSSSEVAAMIEGVLRHCTDMQVEKNYTDTHGQTEVAFAFCALLGFQLLPRIKGIGSQKLYRSAPDDTDQYPNLAPVWAKYAINWDLIRQEYDEMVKHATALRLGTADADSILQRFTRGGLQHPTYQALAEYGKVRKTIFLCQYLASEALRIEIDEGLNVIENWNSANGFIFYGKGAEIATNRREDQEIAILALHLLQISLVFMNTLLVQQVFTDPKWLGRMRPEDFRALTPLFYTHVHPYGVFRLEMEKRLPIDYPKAA